MQVHGDAIHRHITIRLSGNNIPNMSDVNWDIAGVGDFDSDGMVDILWRNSYNGPNRIWLMDGVIRLHQGSIPWLDTNLSAVH